MLYEMISKLNKVHSKPVNVVCLDLLNNEFSMYLQSSTNSNKSPRIVLQISSINMLH